MLSIYAGWGFKANPFETLPLPANRKGSNLMVGREVASRKIRKGLVSSSKFVTVEGLNGVGKTSVINVSVFDAAEDQIKKIYRSTIHSVPQDFSIVIWEKFRGF